MTSTPPTVLVVVVVADSILRQRMLPLPLPLLQKELRRPMLVPPSDFGPKLKDTIR